MNPRVFLLNEPDLFFGGNSRCLDPQVGLLNFGPHAGTDEKTQLGVSISAGVIGTDKSVDTLKLWLARLKGRIPAGETRSTEYKGIDFPGLDIDGPLGFELGIDENCVVRIDRGFVREIAGLESRKPRILRLVKEYCEKLDTISEADPVPKLVLLPIDEEVLSLCKEKNRRGDRIVFQRRDFGDPETSAVELFDFHNHLKAQSARRQLVTQMLSPKTLRFAETKQSPALIGWNFAVAAFYKATGIPWKLAELDNETCYVGVSFYHEIRQADKSMRASIAQVYMRSGESQVIRGEPFEWSEENADRNPHLDTSQMAKIIRDSIDLYTRARTRSPRRIAVHKTTRFTDEETQGCENACANIDELDIVTIRDFVSFRAYHDKHKFPPVRGTAIADDSEAMLFTTGFIPALGTYPGPSAPRPIHVQCQRLDTSIETVCGDLMGLTKLDWNSSTFCRRMPVTIAVSRKVGAVMAEMTSSGIDPPASYRYYM